MNDTLRPACSGTTHTIPVPPGMSVEDAWAELTVLGELLPYDGAPTWTTVQCPGSHRCSCRFIHPAPTGKPAPRSTWLSRLLNRTVRRAR